MSRESCLPRRDWGLEEDGGAAGRGEEEEEAGAAEASLSAGRGGGAIDVFFFFSVEGLLFLAFLFESQAGRFCSAELAESRKEGVLPRVRQKESEEQEKTPRRDARKVDARESNR